MSSRWLCGISVGLVVLLNVGANAQQTAGTVPAYLLTAVGRPLAEFSRLIARATPAGFEIREVDDVAPARPPIIPPEQKSVPLVELVEAFNRTNRSYRAEFSDGVFLVRPVEGRSKFLDSSSPIAEPATHIGVMRALRIVFSPLNAQLLKLSAGSVRGAQAAEALSTPIMLDGSKSRFVLDTLNQVAKQAKGGWLVITRRSDNDTAIVKFGFIHSDASRTMTPMPGLADLKDDKKH